jgi:RNase P subunit RPR2
MHEVEEAARKQQERTVKQLEPVVYEILCKTCHRVLCESKKMRSVLDSHFCCVDDSVWKNVNILATETPSVSFEW